MNWITILAIVGGGVLFLIVLVVIFFIISNKKKAQKLNKVLEQYKKESKQMDQPESLSIAGEEPSISTEEFEAKPEPIIEDYTDLDFLGVDDIPQPPQEEEKKEDDFDWSDFSFIDDEDDKSKKKKTKREPEDEFEEFLDNYSYTRKIIDKDLLKKLNSLPPEVKEIILGNVFNKYD